MALELTYLYLIMYNYTNRPTNHFTINGQPVTLD
jgi:hypothetical protein